MRILKERAAFTMLEILVVVLIVAVMAGVAIPRLFANVERSRSAEALNALGVIKRVADSCASLAANNYGACNNFNNIGLVNPGLVAGAHFNYAFTSAGVNTLVLTATRNTLDGGSGTDTVVLNVSTVGIVRSGTTAFAGIQ